MRLRLSQSMISKLPNLFMGYIRGLKRPLIESAFAIFVGLIVGALIMIIFRHDPIEGYISMLKGYGIFIAKRTFMTREFMFALAFATPYMLTALTFAVGVRAGLFNIGAEGQLYIGAAAASWMAAHVALPSGFHVFAVTVFAMLAGALWAVLPALLKIWKGVHEVISTIMLNWMAFYLVMYLAIYHLRGIWAHITKEALPTARYPVLAGSLTAVIFIALLVCIGVYIFLWRMHPGYELRLVGDNPDAARYAGMSISRAIFLSFIIGGLVAGLAGASLAVRPEKWGFHATLGDLMGYGFAGIGVALVGRNHPIGIIPAAIFFGGLAHSGRFMEFDIRISSELVGAIQGVIIIAMALPGLLALIRRKAK
ncbi:MAG: ABC transporter permease [Candidatus Hodarchaeaceae archaeon]|nr:ABC transporter permease [Candidatus Hodarchaeaceae archaeon]